MRYQYDAVKELVKAGIDYPDAMCLRRIAMTLHRWYELECGDGDNYSSWAIEHDDNGPPFMVHHHYMHGHGKDYITRTRIPDKERGAERQLKAIMARYPKFSFYLQTDPRGAPLYILRPGNTPEGKDAEGHYSYSVVVCK